MRLPTVHDGRSPLLQRPENQVRSVYGCVRGHVQVPCTGLLVVGAPHTSKGQGERRPLRRLVIRCHSAG